MTLTSNANHKPPASQSLADPRPRCGCGCYAIIQLAEDLGWFCDACVTKMVDGVLDIPPRPGRAS